MPLSRALDRLRADAHVSADGFLSLVPEPRVLDRSELRSLDSVAEQEFGIPPAVLMENAALHAARVVRVLAPKAVLVVCGGGNNGGDGFALTRQLATFGVHARAVLVTDPEKRSPLAEMNHNAAQRLGLTLEHPAGSTPSGHAQDLVGIGAWDVVIDAMFGTGLSRPIDGPLADLIETINSVRDKTRRFRTASLDIPSGLDADSGRAGGTVVRADLTVTFASSKVGFGAIEAQHALGEIVLVPIGVPGSLTARFGVPLDLCPGTHWRDAHRDAIGRAGGGSPARPAGRDAAR